MKASIAWSRFMCCAGFVAVGGCRGWDFTEPLDSGERDASPSLLDVGAEDALAIDAPELRLDATRVDAGVDALLPDAYVALDAAVTMDAGRRDDARAVDAATPPDAALPSCPVFTCDCAPSALFCEDFEGPAAGVWASMRGNETLVDNPVGGHAMQVHVDAAASASSRGVGTFAPVTSGEFWARISIWVPSAATVVGISPFFVGQAIDPFQHTAISLVAMGGDDEYGVNADYAGSMSLYGPALHHARRDTWECFELHIVIDGANGAIEAYRNGSLAVQENALSTSLPGGYGAVTYGIAFSHGAQPAVEIFVDNIVVSRARIACP